MANRQNKNKKKKFIDNLTIKCTNIHYNLKKKKKKKNTHTQR